VEDSQGGQALFSSEASGTQSAKGFAARLARFDIRVLRSVLGVEAQTLRQPSRLADLGSTQVMMAQ
jgi:hypothetical protein